MTHHLSILRGVTVCIAITVATGCQQQKSLRWEVHLPAKAQEDSSRQVQLSKGSQTAYTLREDKQRPGVFFHEAVEAGKYDLMVSGEVVRAEVVVAERKLDLLEEKLTAVTDSSVEYTTALYAPAFYGDGSGLTGIAGATGGISNRGSTTIAADTDRNRSGSIALQTGGTTRMLVQSNGNIGIGTASPREKLHVQGTLQATSIKVNLGLRPGQDLNTALQQRGVNAADYLDLPSALSAARQAKATLLITSPVRVRSAISTAVGQSLQIVGGGKLVLNGELRINGPFSAPSRQVFEFGAGGSVKFDSLAARTLDPAWFGAIPDANVDSRTGRIRQGTDNTRAFQRLWDSLPVQLANGNPRANGYEIVNGPGSYFIGGTLRLRKPNVTWRGAGNYLGNALIFEADRDTLLSVEAHGIVLRDLNFVGNGSHQKGGYDGNSLAIAVHNARNPRNADIDQFRVQGCTFSHFGIALDVRARNSIISENLFSVTPRGIVLSGVPGTRGGNRGHRITGNRVHSPGLGNHSAADTSIFVDVKPAANFSEIIIQNNYQDDGEIFVRGSMRSGLVHDNQISRHGFHHVLDLDNRGNSGQNIGVSIKNNLITGLAGSNASRRGDWIRLRGNYYDVQGNVLTRAWDYAIYSEANNVTLRNNYILDPCFNSRRARSAIFVRGVNTDISGNRIQRDSQASRVEFAVDADTNRSNYLGRNLILGIAKAYKIHPAGARILPQQRVHITESLGIGTAPGSGLLNIGHADRARNPSLQVSSGGKTIAVLGDIGSGDYGGIVLNDREGKNRVQIRGAGTSFLGPGSKLAINKNDASATLDVNGNIAAGSIEVSGAISRRGTNYENPDYVFAPDYALMPLDSLREFLAENRHLPGMKSSEQIREEGRVDLFERQRRMLEKLEEAYLYIERLERRLSKLEKASQP